MSDEQFLTVQDVLKLLKLKSRTLYRLVKNRQIPVVRIGRQLRFRRRDIDDWIEKRLSVTDSSGPGERPHVLVLDDEQKMRDMLAEAFTLADYDVDTVGDGPSALEQLRSSRYDLLVTDLKMPGMDGLTVLRELRRHNAELPVIIVTAYSTEASAIEAINLGCQGYLTKPFRMPKILALASRALGESEAIF